eukprot:1323591-Amorphochlora_amoeboformis.AAC.1
MFNRYFCRSVSLAYVGLLLRILNRMSSRSAVTWFERVGFRRENDTGRWKGRIEEILYGVLMVWEVR